MIRSKKIEHSVEKLLPKLRDKLRLDDSILFMYVFGSYGKGRSGPLSDVDIGVFLKGSEDYWKKRLQLIGEITSILKTDEVDLVILNEASLSLRFQVIKTGKIIFSRDEEKRIDFEAKTYDFYCDTEPLRKLHQNALLKRLREGRFGH